MSEKNEWKLVPVEPTPEMWAAVNKLDDEMAAGAYDGKGASIEQIWACLVDAAPCPTCNDQGAVGNILNAQPCPDCTPAASAPGDAQDESIALDRLADYIADNWPDKKYGLEEICQRLSATWPGAFMPADSGAQKVVIDFDQVGSAGPFLVIDGKVGIPAITVQDLVRMAAPAAGDALALLDHPLLRDVLGYIEDAGPADVWGAAQSWMALRDAAQVPQQGEA